MVEHFSESHKKYGSDKKQKAKSDGTANSDGASTPQSAPEIDSPEDDDIKPWKIGDIISEKYEVLGQLDEGGIGEGLFRCKDRLLKEEVAIRLLKIDHEKVYKRLEEEVMSISRLRSANILEVFEFRKNHGKPYMVMELATGGDLHKKIKEEGPLSEYEFLKMMIPVVEALHLVHQSMASGTERAAPIYHLNIKSSNIFLMTDGTPKLSDLGMAILSDTHDSTSKASRRRSSPYTAPEKARNSKSIGPEADIFSLGATFYYLLTGQHPAPVFGYKLPWSLREVVLKCIEPEPKQRYRSIKELLSILKEKKNKLEKKRDILLEKGRRAYQKSRFKDSRMRFDEVLNLDPQNTEARKWITVYENATGNTHKLGLLKNKARYVIGCFLALTMIVFIALFISRRSKEVQEEKIKKVPGRYELPDAFKNLSEDAADFYGNPIRKTTSAATGWPIEIKHKGTGMYLVSIDAEEFQMGNAETGQKMNTPLSMKAIRPFYIGKYEVTQAEWKKVMGENSSRFTDDKKPVEMVFWEECQTFIQKMNQKLGKENTFQFSLPTDKQWEYASRAGNRSKQQLNAHAWYGSNSKQSTHRVGQKNPNAWGLYDMYGNVWEWCLDGWPNKNDKEKHLIRGGSWYSLPETFRTIQKDGNPITDRRDLLGVRVVLNRRNGK